MLFEVLKNLIIFWLKAWIKQEKGQLCGGHHIGGASAFSERNVPQRTFPNKIPIARKDATNISMIYKKPTLYCIHSDHGICGCADGSAASGAADIPECVNGALVDVVPGTGVCIQGRFATGAGCANGQFNTVGMCLSGSGGYRTAWNSRRMQHWGRGPSWFL